MISDDKMNDDFLDDDLDIEELDDLDDLSDDWDDLDADEDVSSSEKSPKTPGAHGEKTFIQKNFYPIVGGVILLAGGLFAYGQFGGGSSSAPAPLQDDISASVPALDNAEMPPMPAPMNAPEEDVAAIIPEVDTIVPVTQEPAVLTPMPDPSATSETPAELPALLDIAEAPAVKPEAQDMLVDTPELAVDLTDDPLSDLGEVDAAFEAPVENNVPEPAVASSQEIAEDEGFNISPEPLITDGEILDFNDHQAEEDEALVLEAQTLDIESAPPVLPVENQAEEVAAAAEAAQAVRENELRVEQDALKAEISERDEALQELKSSMEAEMAAANQKLADLSGTILELEKQISSMKSGAVPATVETSPSLEKSVAPKTKAAPKVAAKPAVSKKKQVRSKVFWTLRSAQSGRATLSSSTSGGLYNAEVGDTLPGLGKITSIAKENGKWVVRGTQGRVSQ